MPSTESRRCRPPIPAARKKWTPCLRNGWSAWPRTSGRHPSESMVGMARITQYCDRTPALAGCLAQLPKSEYDFEINGRDMESQWPEEEKGIAYRWNAISQIVDLGSDGIEKAWGQLMIRGEQNALREIGRLFLIPVFNYLVHRLDDLGMKLYLLLRYKRWAEWFEGERLRKVYASEGENGLDRDLRCFLFESGVDYPFSQPRSPQGQADIVAELDTDDPLVLEVKVWDSEKGYGKDRVRDGLRQVMDYADRYEKDKGYVPVFNLDLEPLVLAREATDAEWPARIERGGKTYFFITINIAKQSEPVSKRRKGKLVRVNEIQLEELWESLDND
jgi:hypothetical protein